MFEQVYQCGHCGTVHPDKHTANECCGGYAEESYQCKGCGELYSKRPTTHICSDI